MEYQEHRADHRKHEEACLRPKPSTGEPVAAMKCCCQQAVWGELSAVWSGVDEDCSKIKRRMESNGEAQIARTPQRQAKQQGDQASRGPVRPALVRFREIVKRAEEE